MDESEKAIRLEALTEMFLGFGQPVEADRLRYYGNLTQHIPLGIFKQACRLAAIETSGSFPPGPGDIVKAGIRLHPGEYSPHGTSLPHWARVAIATAKRRELPQDAG